MEKNKQAKILIIDDDPMLCRTLKKCFEYTGYLVSAVNTVSEGLKEVHANNYDVIYLDVRMPDGNGLSILPEIKSSHAEPEVIIMTGAADENGAAMAINNGAWDYIEKTSSLEEIKFSMKQALEYREKKLLSHTPIVFNREGIIGSSSEINQCMEMAGEIARSNAPVLITGETGTGKENFARAIHNNSPRNSGNFVVVDCTVLPENLVESALFGHTKGAFTGADRDAPGLIGQAKGGTLFLDEIGDLPISIQKSFLRVLQEKTYRSVGSSKEQKSDFRVISATNRNLDTMVKDGIFRKDLLFRLKSFTIELPPLKNRKGDIRELVNYYVPALCDAYQVKHKGISPDFIETLAAYNWPGNIRELINALEHAVTVSSFEPILYPNHLPSELRIHKVLSTINTTTHNSENDELILDFEKPLPTFKIFKNNQIEKAEKAYLKGLMEYCKGDIKQACSIASLGKTRLYSLLKQHGLK